MADVDVKPKKRWMKYLLIVSLGLNLLVAGLAVGAKVAGPPHHKGGSFAGASGLRGFMRALPDSKRGEVRKYFRTNRDKIHASGDAMRETMNNIHAVILAQPFEADVLNTAFAKQRAHITTVTEDAQKAFVAIIASMTDAERIEYVENMKKHHRKLDKKRKRKENKE